MGEKDDIEINKLEDDLKVIESKASSCPSFTRKILKEADHVYDGKENELSEMIIEWVNSLNL